MVYFAYKTLDFGPTFNHFDSVTLDYTKQYHIHIFYTFFTLLLKFIYIYVHYYVFIYYYYYPALGALNISFY